MMLMMMMMVVVYAGSSPSIEKEILSSSIRHFFLWLYSCALVYSSKKADDNSDAYIYIFPSVVYLVDCQYQCKFLPSMTDPEMNCGVLGGTSDRNRNKLIITADPRDTAHWA